MRTQHARTASYADSSISWTVMAMEGHDQQALHAARMAAEHDIALMLLHIDTMERARADASRRVRRLLECGATQKAKMAEAEIADYDQRIRRARRTIDQLVQRWLERLRQEVLAR